jgi:hypothetical protein
MAERDDATDPVVYQHPDTPPVWQPLGALVILALMLLGALIVAGWLVFHR